ncbi:tetratricopeptide repeat protein [Nitrosomonas oligotropha]|uniref:tetratricopeptide repeat protein n=1 Tax=Nitrosomonas oligotropha TaxID=42354 RepID=UPI00136E0F08|nr:tetratricopeptide repeat protein [Nitrosomonas oligotropha]MXS82003.1 tetratricopeptide repeat protein [Nitrosomonas oligotropha]
MEIAQIIEWLDKHKDAIASIGLIVSGIWAFWVWKKKQAGSSTTGIQNQNSPNSGKQINAPVTANDHAAVNQHFGDTYHHYGYDDSKVAELAAKLASEFRKEDTETIKTLQETIQALTQQNAQKYDIQQALDLLAQGDTTQAEAIFAGVAAEAKQEGKKASIKEAEALRHLGSLAFLHDTQKALTAYQRSTELDPDNLDGWNNLGHLYQRIGELEKAENAYTTVQKLSLLQLNRAGEAAAYGNLGVIYWTRGELNRTIEYYEKALVIDEELKHKAGMACDYGNLGLVYQTRGDLECAIEYHEKALAINKVLGCKEGMASQYANLGSIYETCGDLDRAVEYWKQSLMLFQQLGAKDKIALVQSWIDEAEQKDSN